MTIPGTIQIVTSGGEAVQGLQAMPISATGAGQATVVQYQPQQVSVDFFIWLINGGVCTPL